MPLFSEPMDKWRRYVCLSLRDVPCKYYRLLFDRLFCVLLYRRPFRRSFATMEAFPCYRALRRLYNILRIFLRKCATIRVQSNFYFSCLYVWQHNIGFTSYLQRNNDCESRLKLRHYLTFSVSVWVVCTLKQPSAAGAMLVGGFDGETPPPGPLPCCISVNQQV